MPFEANAPNALRNGRDYAYGEPLKGSTRCVLVDMLTLDAHIQTQRLVVKHLLRLITCNNYVMKKQAQLKVLHLK